MGNTFIEINGKRYDAQNGTLLGDGTKPAAAVRNVARQGRVVDGFVHPGKLNTTVNQANQKQIVAQLAAKKAHLAAIKATRTAAFQAGKAVTLHKPEPTKTLMRHIVKKPAVTAKKPLKIQAPKEMTVAVTAAAAPSHKLAAHAVDEQRLTRSRSMRQSQHIKRFSTAQQNHPLATTRQQDSVQSSAAISTVAAPRGQHSDIRRSYNTNTVHAVRRPQTAVASTPKPQASQHNDIFEAAIANARSHEQPAHKPRRKARSRILQMASLVVAFIAIGGFVAYLNMPNIELRIASTKAGFHAQLPDYKPTGYALNGGVKASNGVVSVNFRSGSSHFTLQQQASNWDSRTLLDNVVAMASESHQTYQSQGRTVYVYGNNAAWVNGGILYSMKITGDMTHQEIVSVASSI